MQNMHISDPRRETPGGSAMKPPMPNPSQYQNGPALNQAPMSRNGWLKFSLV